MNSLRESRLIPATIAAMALVGSGCWITPIASGQDSAGSIESRTVEVEGRSFAVRHAASASPESNNPTIVFECVLGTPMAHWDLVAPSVAQFAPVFAYDRAGLGGSEADGETPTPRHVATSLRNLLKAAEIKPPFVLVGHSLGGAYIRSFAALYPDEVAGLVYVDASPITKTMAGELAMWTKLGSGEEGMAKFRRGIHAGGESAPPAIAAELVEAARLWATDYADVHALGPAPDVPTVVLAADARHLPLDRLAADVGVEATAFAHAYQGWRMEVYESLVSASSRGTLLRSTQSGHAIAQDEPELVVWAIRRVLAVPALNARSIMNTIDVDGLDAGLAQFEAARAEMPEHRVTFMLLTEVGFMLFQERRIDDAIRVLELNVRTFPEASIAHGSLGQAYLAAGRREEAIAAFEKALELNPEDRRAAGMLERLQPP